jgi:hypothetical protein
VVGRRGKESGVERQGSGATTWREAAAAPRLAAAWREEAAPRLGSLMAQNQISPRFEFHVSRVTPLIPGTLLVSTDIIQPIPKM